MYSDPTKLRTHVVKLRFSDEEAAIVDAFVNYTGEQKACLLRDLILEQITAEIGAHHTPLLGAMTAPAMALPGVR